MLSSFRIIWTNLMTRTADGATREHGNSVEPVSVVVYKAAMSRHRYSA
jgi:hypothetical protein